MPSSDQPDEPHFKTPNPQMVSLRCKSFSQRAHVCIDIHRAAILNARHQQSDPRSVLCMYRNLIWGMHLRQPLLSPPPPPPPPQSPPPKYFHPMLSVWTAWRLAPAPAPAAGAPLFGLDRARSIHRGPRRRNDAQRASPCGWWRGASAAPTRMTGLPTAGSGYGRRRRRQSRGPQGQT